MMEKDTLIPQYDGNSINNFLFFLHPPLVLPLIPITALVIQNGIQCLDNLVSGSLAQVSL